MNLQREAEPERASGTEKENLENQQEPREPREPVEPITKYGST